ncbi:hypothetical protein EV1_033094 [Malus domestica]
MLFMTYYIYMMGRDDILVGLGNVFAVGQYYSSFASLGQPIAIEVWKTIVKSLDPGSKITLLTNGPLTNLAEIILFENADSVVHDVGGHIRHGNEQGNLFTIPSNKRWYTKVDVYIVEGHIRHDNEKGNLFTVPSNEYEEFNMFLNPLAARAVFDPKLNITLIP